MSRLYLSWFLKDEMIEIYPMVERMDNYKLSDLKTAVFEDCSKYRFAKNVEQEKENTIGTDKFGYAQEFV